MGPLLFFMYSGFNTLNQYQIPGFLKLAEDLQVRGLHDLSEDLKQSEAAQENGHFLDLDVNPQEFVKVNYDIPVRQSGFVCSMCQNTFATNKILMRHMRCVHNGEGVICSECG